MVVKQMKKKENTSKDIGLRLRALRLSAGYTQKNIAELLGVNRATYSYIESSKTPPAIEYLCKIAALYGMQVSELFCRCEIDENDISGKRAKKTVESDPQNISELSPKEKTLIALIRVRGEDFIDRVLEIVKEITTKN